MKNEKNWFGILVMVLVFGMAVAGCDDGSDDKEEFDTRPRLSVTVRFDKPYPVVGETITASFVKGFQDPIGTASWTWYKTQENESSLYFVKNKTSIGFGTTYTVRQADAGSWIWAEVSYSGNFGSEATRTSSTVIGVPAMATVSVSIRAIREPRYDSYDFMANHSVYVTLTLSDGKWNDVPYNTASQWITMSGTPSVSTWPDSSTNHVASARGRELVFYYTTRSETTLSISNLTAALKTDQLTAMRSSTNVYNALTAGTPATVSVSQWTIQN